MRVIHRSLLPYLRENLRFYTDQEPGTNSEKKHHPDSIRMDELADKEKLGGYLEELQAKVYTQGESVQTVSSQLSKRLAFLPLAAFVAMSAFHRRIRLTPEQCHLRSQYVGQKWLPYFWIDQVTIDKRPAEGQEAWRNQIVDHMLGSILNPIFLNLSPQRKTSRVMWDNFATYLRWVYEKKIPHDIGREENGDYRYILEEAIPQIAGLRLKSQRTTCCFTHLVGAGGKRSIQEKLADSKDLFCTGCPITLIKKQSNEQQRSQ